MTQLQLFQDYTALARSELTALADRKGFLAKLKEKRSTIEYLFPAINKRKSQLIERAPEGEDLTEYVAEHLEVSPVERARLTSFLRQAYPHSRGKRWERIHDAELFNTARRVYRKLDGVETMKLDEFMRRVTEDREGYQRLGHVLPLETGIGFSYEIEAPAPGENYAKRIATPLFLLGYSTDEHLWTAAAKMSDERLVMIGSVRGAAQVSVARKQLEDIPAILADRYHSRVKGLEIHAEPMDPEKRYAI